jgi:hypothetical protein
VPLDFPSGPAINDTWTASNGATYTFDGTKWTVSGSGVGPYLPLAGGTMTGALALAADPTTSPQAANKHYVDQSINLAGNYLGTWSVAANTPNISAGGAISNANYVATTVHPATPEVVPGGVPGIAGLTVANGDRVIWASGLGTWQILRNAGVTLAAADARYVALGGSVMTGALTLPGNAASALQAVPLQQVPVASSTTPAMNGTATVGAGTTWARADHIHPTDTSRASVASVTAAGAAAANNVWRNLIHNSMFNVAQRGAGPWTSTSNGAYTLDRWLLYTNTDTISITQAALNDADRGQIGDEAAEQCIFNTFTGNAAAAASTEIVQRIEKVRRLGGKSVTVSFWARVTSGAATKVGVSYAQVFGTGGSPSTAVLGAGTAVTISSSWARYSVTMAMPSVVGKTLGTAGDDSTQIEFWYTSGATNATRAGSIGVQSGAIALWGVQLEIGSVATPLEKPDPQVDLANCQRFYQTGHFSIMGSSGAGGQFGSTLGLPVAMRAAPTVALVAPSYTNASGGASGNAGSTSAILNYANATAAGSTAYFSGDFTASADL